MATFAKYDIITGSYAAQTVRADTSRSSGFIQNKWLAEFSEDERKKRQSVRKLQEIAGHVLQHTPA